MLVNADQGYRGMHMNKVKGTSKNVQLGETKTTPTSKSTLTCVVYSHSFMFMFYVVGLI